MWFLHSRIFASWGSANPRSLSTILFITNKNSPISRTLKQWSSRVNWMPKHSHYHCEPFGIYPSTLFPMHHITSNKKLICLLLLNSHTICFNALGYHTHNYLNQNSKQPCWVPPRYKLLLLLSHFSRVRLCATPETAAHQAPQSLGFSRQEHQSGLPFPSPVHESEKWKWNRSVVSTS